jgi:hypothetical protein
MKRNFGYLLALLILSALTYYFVFREEAEVFDKAEANFTVKDTAAIQTIFLSNLKNENIKLSRSSGVWKLNDSMAPRLDAIQLLLAALNQQKPTQPVPVSAHNSVITDLSGNNTKVEIYNHKEKTHTFYVGLNPGPNNETYMLNENAKRPFLVKLPLQNTFVGVRYFTRINEWRNKKILAGSAPIESIQVLYSDSVIYSFKIEKSAQSYSVSGPYPIAKPLNHKRAKEYIALFENVYCMGFEEKYMYKDSIIQHGRQLATIRLQRNGEPMQEITFYFKPAAQGTKKPIIIGGISYDNDSFFGLLNKKDFILVGRKITERILKTYPEFYEMDVQ